VNRNLSEAVSVIHTTVASVRPEQAAAIAHALDSARLLADPGRLLGIVLHRTADGGWSSAPRGTTELERQALARDASCGRARRVAAAVERDIGRRPGVLSVRADGDTVRVVLHVEGPDQWARWRTYFGITPASPGAAAGGAAREKRPFRLGGITYDLVLPYRDAQGDLWYFQGLRTPDGMPMMSPDGRPERCSLANVEAYAGPLTPVPDAHPAEGRPR
jgi:hypothetical protein